MKQLLFLTILILTFAAIGHAQTVEPSPSDNQVCVSQSEANEIFRLAEIGKKFPAYEAKTDKDIAELKDVIKNRDASIVTLQINYAKAVQDAINLSNQAIRDNATIQRYQTYFFEHPQPKCKWTVVCVP